MAALVDTNILVYRFDHRSPAKQARAIELLDQGIADRTLCIAYQSVVEFHAAVTKRIAGREPFLDAMYARKETEELLLEFKVIYPTESIVRVALLGVAGYQLSWFDALIWAHAEEAGLEQLISEDFQHDRVYGTVRVLNPFL